MPQLVSLRARICIYAMFMFCARAGAQTLTQRHIATSPDNPGFYEWLPEGYKATGSQHWPLLIFFNGSGDFGNGDSAELVYVLKNGPGRLMKEGQWPDSFTVRGKTFRFIVILPEFDSVPTLPELDSVVNYSLKHYNADTNRVYMTGLSSGGNAVWYYASASVQRARRLAAIVPISAGTLWTGEAGAQVMASARLAIFAAANQYDSTIPSTATVQAIGLINSIVPSIVPKALDTIYDATGHDAWTETYDPEMNLHDGLNAYQWMLQYSRSSLDSTSPIVTPPQAQLASFFAQYLAWQKEVTLSWTTTAGQPNQYFLVQRSTDGREFSSIDTVKTGADSANGQYYNAVDAHPVVGSDYYRIAQVSGTGQLTYSASREVTVLDPPTTLRNFTVSPNPTAGLLNVDLEDSASGAVRIRIIDPAGRTIRTWIFQKQTQTWHQSIEIGNLEKGDYFIQVSDRDMLSTKPFVKL